MTSLATSDNSPALFSKFGNWPLLLAALLLGGLAVSAESFWMDEASTATNASQPTLASWWHWLSTRAGSDTQMPFYMVYIWGWVKLFGCSEWGLRAANLPWLALGLLALPRRQAGFICALAASPFLWFYLNEARPYVMQISASLIVAGTLIRLSQGTNTIPAGANKAERRWVTFFCFGLVVLSGSSLLGMIWTAAALGALLLCLGWKQVWRLFRICWLPGSLTALLLVGLAGYYLWTLKNGNRAAQGTTGIRNILFIA
jgi:uncharacterized membrane protein